MVSTGFTALKRNPAELTFNRTQSPALRSPVTATADEVSPKHRTLLPFAAARNGDWPRFTSPREILAGCFSWLNMTTDDPPFALKTAVGGTRMAPLATVRNSM